ncbi:MAG: UDP-N-acetylmuramoyl-tripeptide--D-alanyl-D-alanine ligase [Planctomycetota bacterium]|nr:UDP-N-acetylmuramoyl-tripeptide--D-alanyl-D-alanine ligase [Planctomycetota bacterium]
MIEIPLDALAEMLDARTARADSSMTIRGIGTDTRTDLGGRIFIAIRGERHDGHDHLEQARDAGAVAALVGVDDLARRGIDRIDGLALVVVEDPIAAMTTLARHHRASLSGPVIGVTGSAGKTTTRAILEGVLAPLGRGTASIRSFNNHLGVPMTLLEASPDDAWVVLEMGTSGPGEIPHLVSVAAPDIAILTGTGRAHLEGFGDEAGVAREKARILDGARMGIVNVDRPAILPELPRRASAGLELITYGESATAGRRLHSRIPRAEGGQRIELDDFTAELSLEGRHNAINAVAAIEVARRLGVPDAEVAAALGRLRPPAMRFDRREFGGILVLDDAYNANPESMAAALEAFSEVATVATRDDARRIAVLGAMLELGGEGERMHHELGGIAARSAATHLVVVRGDHGAAIAEGAREAGRDLTIETVEDAAEAAARVDRLARPGDVVLVKASRGVGLERVVEAIHQRREPSA